jgi:hypothetical protein
MYAVTVTILAFFILFGYEIRYRFLIDDLKTLKELTGTLREDVAQLKEEIKMKQDIYERFEGPKKG